MTQPTITSVETILLDLPTIRPHVLSMASIDTQTVALVTITASDGIEGNGEGTTIAGLSYGEESPEGIKLAIDTYIAPLLIGLPANQVGLAMANIQSKVTGNRFAKNAIETALLDAHGKRLGIPASELLGGRRRETLPVLWTLASGSPEEDIDEAKRLIAERRHNAFKIKIGRREPADDIAHVASIRNALGDDVSLRVDANQRWSESTTRACLPALAAAGVSLIEQPVPYRSRAAMARLRAISPVSIMADEAIQGPQDIFDLCAGGAADVYSIKIAQCGGPSAARAAAEVALASGHDLYGGTMLESGVGTIASAQLFVTLPNIAYGTELFGPLLLHEDILAAPLHYADFELAVPQAPGLGIQLDWDRIAFYRRDRARTVSAAFGRKAH